MRTLLHELQNRITRREIADRYRTQGYFFSSTGGSPLSSVVGTTVLDIIEDEQLCTRATDIGDRLLMRLRSIADRQGMEPIGDVRGLGAMVAFELVKDRATKETFDPALKLNARIKKHAFEGGLICYPGGATADGVRGDHVLLAPPFIINDEQLDELVDKLGDAVDRSLGEIT